MPVTKEHSCAPRQESLRVWRDTRDKRDQRAFVCAETRETGEKRETRETGEKRETRETGEKSETRELSCALRQESILVKRAPSCYLCDMNHLFVRP